MSKNIIVSKNELIAVKKVSKGVPVK